MKLTLNFGLLKNMEIGFIHNNESYHNVLINVKKHKNIYKFKFNENYIEIDDINILYFKIEKIDNIIWFIYDSSILSGMVPFSMSDTYGFPYGFPYELTKEILSEKKLEIDENGYYILKEIQKSKNKNTFKNKNAF